ncbi:MAG: hypothetical protein JRI76_09750 [Deltaproteobacteria bacterium]|nr:hypothetical protein [Deltaproteobacteria bacterium]MBW2042301.1 hypothetical protein [Deltaproteobacteria bacterium]
MQFLLHFIKLCGAPRPERRGSPIGEKTIKKASLDPVLKAGFARSVSVNTEMTGRRPVFWRIRILRDGSAPTGWFLKMSIYGTNWIDDEDHGTLLRDAVERAVPRIDGKSSLEKTLPLIENAFDRVARIAA